MSTQLVGMGSIQEVSACSVLSLHHVLDCGDMHAELHVLYGAYKAINLGIVLIDSIALEGLLRRDKTCPAHT